MRLHEGQILLFFLLIWNHLEMYQKKIYIFVALKSCSTLISVQIIRCILKACTQATETCVISRGKKTSSWVDFVYVTTDQMLHDSSTNCMCWYNSCTTHKHTHRSTIVSYASISIHLYRVSKDSGCATTLKNKSILTTYRILCSYWVHQIFHHLWFLLSALISVFQF